MLPNLFKELARKVLAKAGYAVVRERNRYMQDGVFTVHSDHFRQSPEFREAYNRGILSSNGVDAAFEWRVHVALWAASMGLHVPGDFVECGVNAGFISSAIMHHLRWNTVARKFYLIDTFQGPVLPQYSQTEIEHGRRSLAERALATGAYVTDLERVRENYSEWPNAVIVQGVVPDVLSTLGLERIAFLHLDMNCAYPETAAFELLWERLGRGSVVLLDDYAYFGHGDQMRSLDVAAKRVGAEILSLPTGQGLIIK